jgi:hypothetical protein
MREELITRGGERGAGGGLGGAGGGKGVAGEEEGGVSLLAPRPLSSLSSSTKEKRKRRERTSADDDDDDGGSGGGGGRDVVVGVGVGVVPPERRPPRRPLFLLLPGRAGRRGRGGGLETAAMRTPAAARTTAMPWVGGSDDGLRRCACRRWRGQRRSRGGGGSDDGLRRCAHNKSGYVGGTAQIPWTNDVIG